tara:strand:+ start:4238 stop:4963 length:726 start_codon:yes stop_codon:yes gene_type:complete
MKLDLLGVGSNAKTIKSDKGGVYKTAILYLAPAEQVDGVNLCPMSKKANCRDACLYTAGRGAFNNVQAARIRKTMLWRDHRAEFIDRLNEDIYRFTKHCLRHDVLPAVRLNGTSDIMWEQLDGGLFRMSRNPIMMNHPSVQFYDYTKILSRVDRRPPPNYHLTLSYSGASPRYKRDVVEAAKRTGTNMAVVFRDEIPDMFEGLPVVNGDKDDLRFLDPPRHVVGLTAKGQAKRDTSGFVVD